MRVLVVLLVAAYSPWECRGTCIGLARDLNDASGEAQARRADEARAAHREAYRTDAEYRRRHDRQLHEDLERARKQPRGDDHVEDLRAYVDRVVEYAGSETVRLGEGEVQPYADDAAARVEAAIVDQGVHGLFEQLAELPRTPAVDAAVVRMCHALRAEVERSDRHAFVERCFVRAGEDPTRLTWPGAADDLRAIHRAP